MRIRLAYVALLAILLLQFCFGANEALASANNEINESELHNNLDISVQQNVYGEDHDSITELPKSSLPFPSPQLPNSSNVIEPQAEIGPTYPSTNISMRIGDILYSTKTIGASSQIVGHVGIVNSNFKMVHVTLPVDGGVVDNMSTYMGRHGSGETIKVYRPKNGMGVAAARWATYNYSSINEYYINPFAKLGDLNPNYCSKFIWQAFWFGEGVNIGQNELNANTNGYVTPTHIINSPKLVYVTSFKAP